MTEHLVNPPPEEDNWSVRLSFSTSFLGCFSVVMALHWQFSDIPLLPNAGWWTIGFLILTGLSMLVLWYVNRDRKKD